MGKLKTKKSLLKRFRITKTGKILRRVTGQDHSLAKKSGRKRRQIRRFVSLSSSEVKLIKKLIKL